MAIFRWTLIGASGGEVRTTEPFESQKAAEDWMGAEWASLIDEGAESVSLVAGEHEVVYTMGLREE